MFNGLSNCYEPGVHHLALLKSAHDLVAFFHETFDGFADFAARFFTRYFENTLKAVYVALGLFFMIFKRLLQFGR
jgi:hypothetical protein